MPAKLYVVHGSHPCAAVQRALEVKGIPFKVVELPPPLHAPLQRMRFGQRTVPSIKLDDGEKLSGSRAILRRLEALAPEPPLVPTDPDLRAKVEQAEHWGEEVLQPMARRFVWQGMQRHPAAIVSYSEHSSLPLPNFMARATAPMIALAERKLNNASDEATHRDFADLPGHLDRVDGYIADGIIGGENLNVADLQIATTIRLMMTVGDVRALIDGRPCGELARRLFPDWDGDLPVGVFPADWIPAPAAAPAS